MRSRNNPYLCIHHRNKQQFKYRHSQLKIPKTKTYLKTKLTASKHYTCKITFKSQQTVVMFSTLNYIYIITMSIKIIKYSGKTQYFQKTGRLI